MLNWNQSRSVTHYSNLFVTLILLGFIAQPVSALEIEPGYIALIVVGIVLIIAIGIGAYVGYVKYMNYKINKNWNGKEVWNKQREKELKNAKKLENERKMKMDKSALAREEEIDNKLWQENEEMKKGVEVKEFTTDELLNPDLRSHKS